MNQSSILLVGAGGHALACIDVIEANGKWRIHGLLGAPEEQGANILGHFVRGTDADMESLFYEGASALVCLGQIKSAESRERIFAKLCQLGYSLPTIVSPTAWVSPHAKIGAGSIVMHGAIVNAGAAIGENCIINTRAVVEHGAIVDNHCHISTGALLNGNAKVGAGSFIGSGSKIKQGVCIGKRCVVGMGASVYSDLSDGVELRLGG